MTVPPPDAPDGLDRRVRELEQALQASAAETHRLRHALDVSRERQRAGLDILATIAATLGDADHALQRIAEISARLFGASSVSIQLAENGQWGKAYRYGDSAQRIRQAVPLTDIKVGGRNMPGAVVGRNQQIHVPDLDHLDASVADFPGLPHARAAGSRTMCGTPLRSKGKAIGSLIVHRDRLDPFSDEELALQQSFADQAAIAIENARLFNAVEAKARDLADALHHLRTAQDRLVQTEKLASLGQLTAGIAHEIKNPLNFVNNFAALSVELIAELRPLLAGADLDQGTRKEVDDLAGLLTDNLDKIVQHGKRADSIVRNMLLHSREGGGEHRPVDLNALLDESLNLAYHGARAETPGFNVALERDFDPEAGQVELFPQEMTRVFLNLVANGFYAVAKRQREDGEPGYRPVLLASTRNAGDAVVIRIRDNGTGIAAEVSEKMFNPFFTTKPPGEGTGLGLSMSHDIVVKQHGGAIDVASIPGEFTEFTIRLPRRIN